MAAGTMATAAAVAMVLYMIRHRRVAASKEEDEGVKLGFARSPVRAPANLLESLLTITETLRFSYSETLGKWPIADLAFGINYFMRKQGNLEVASVYGGSGCVQLKGPEIVTELHELSRLLTLCMFFSKKPFPVFLDSAGISLDDVLGLEPKAGVLKPAFTIIRDTQSKCFLLLIRGTHSIKDTLTAATGAVVPFHHSVLNDGEISNLVLGYAHCGMVAAARWIAKLCTPTLQKALGEFPDFKVKIVGHSLGGGTAALLTYILREQKEFSSSICVTFAPAACMTWELAESGKHFIKTIVNGSDLVPTFSTSSVDDLRSEVTASSWLNDLRDQVEHTKVLNVVYRSAAALGSHLQSISSAKARVAGAGAILQPVTSGTQVIVTGQVVLFRDQWISFSRWVVPFHYLLSYRDPALYLKVVVKHAQSVAEAVVKTRSSLSSWSCMSARRRRNIGSLNSKSENLTEVCRESLVTKEVVREPILNQDEEPSTPSENRHDDRDEKEQLIIPANQYITTCQEEEAATANEITEEENHVVVDNSEGSNPVTTSDNLDSHRFYPPGRIMHIVSVPSSSHDDSCSNSSPVVEHVCLYETPRKLYSKLRLSRTMINDHYMPMYKKMMELLIQELER